MATLRWVLAPAALVVSQAVFPTRAAVQTKAAVMSLRLYLFNCGPLNVTAQGVERYHVTPDRLQPGGHHVCGHLPHAHRPHGQPQLVRRFDLGHTPRGARLQWAENNTRVNTTFFTALKDRPKVRALDKDEYDVFGDGTVVMKAAPGHTPGHRVLILRLASTARIMLSGDLYHYPQERAFKRAPPDNEFGVEQSAARDVRSRSTWKTRTPLWIEHDFNANANAEEGARLL